MTIGRVMTVNTQAVANTFGGFEVVPFIPGQTIERVIWYWHATGAGASNTGFPPGSAIVKVGLTVDATGIPQASMPTPITQNTIRWMDIQTFGWRGGIAASTQTEWLWFAGDQDEEHESRTRWENNGATNLSLYLTWESKFAIDTDPTFTFNPTVSADVFVRS
jgi:hypothetical protein